MKYHIVANSIRGSNNYDYFLTSVASNGICQFHFWTKFPHLFDYLADLKSKLVCWRNAQALKEPVFLNYQFKTGTWTPDGSADGTLSLPESTYWLGLHGSAWQEKKQQFYLYQTATGQSDSEVCSKRTRTHRHTHSLNFRNNRTK